MLLDIAPFVANREPELCLYIKYTGGLEMDYSGVLAFFCVAIRFLLLRR
ncbi:hypothetical protein J3R74_002049 [Puniceicoccus vermicola]